MLAGLPEQYKPMIMGIQSSGIKITGDSIKMKLLQDVKCDTEDSALASRMKNKFHKKANCKNNSPQSRIQTQN